MTTPTLFRSKPVTIRAIQFTGGNFADVSAFMGFTPHFGDAPHGLLAVHLTTVHGEQALARVGDWIIPEAEPGRFYPCKDDVFRAKYEPVANPASPTVHFAGLDVQVGPLLRQRCAWCDYVLLDYDLTRTASPCDDRCADGCQPAHHRPATWTPGTLVAAEGVSPRTTVHIPHEDGQPLPENACAAG